MQNRSLKFLAAVLAVLMFTSGQALAEKRIALVIGNGEYRNPTVWPKLKNPPNDAQDLAETLSNLVFELIGGGVQLDLDKAGMERVIIEFGEQLGEGTVGLFYFAGHGLAVNKTNYLLPVNANTVTKKTVNMKLISADLVMDQFPRKGGLNILILDACRNTPASVRGVRGDENDGLVQMNAPTGTLISYATQPGNVALDGRGRNSPYAAALKKMMQKPGVSILEVFNDVGLEVEKNTDGFQRPWINASPLEGDFYFKPGPVAAVATVQPKQQPAPPVDREAMFWDTIKTSERARDFEEYLKQFPEGTFSGLAHSLIEALKHKQVAMAAPPKPAFEVDEIDATYVALKTANLRFWPSTQSKKVGQLKADTGLNVTGRVRGKNWYRVEKEDGLSAYVFGDLLKSVDAADLAHWDRIINSRFSDDFQAYLSRFPDGHFAERAKRLVKALKPKQQTAMVVPPKPSPAPSKAQPAVGIFPKKSVQTFKDCDECPEMVVIQAGSFRMGDLSGGGDSDEKPVHDVRIPRPFAVGMYEVTQKEWLAVMGSNPSRFKSYLNPVEQMSWDEAKEYVRRLSAKTEKQYRLLSEAEWEYMARAGSSSKYPFGSSESSLCSRGNGGETSIYYIWRKESCNDGYVKRTAPVGSFQPNSFGAYDTVGNVLEWVEDCYHDSYHGAPSDGSAWTSGGDCSIRVLRGGSWSNYPKHLRSADRSKFTTGNRLDNLGFRVARTLSPETTIKQQAAFVAPPRPPLPIRRNQGATPPSVIPAELSEITKFLDPGEALLVYDVAPKETSLWVVRSGSADSYILDIGIKQLAETVGLLRTALEPNAATLGDIPNFDLAAAYDLYEKLLKPVEAGWKDAKHLLVVVDGGLGYLPLSLLPTARVELGPEKAPLFANYRDVPWLARTHSVTVLPSVASLRALRGTVAAGGERRPFAGFGDPYFSLSQALAAEKTAPKQVASAEAPARGPTRLGNKPQTRIVDSAELAKLPRLPDTRTEINTIAATLGAVPDRDVFLGRRASEHRIKTMDLSVYKVISFATHGLVPGDLIGLDQPALAFSNPQVTGDEDEDGLLTMGEIMTLKLNADLVVLSGSNTASAVGKGAEAVSGLAGAFFHAGARALLASNWPVFSPSTKTLITDLFRRQAEDPELNWAEALRQAMLDLIDGDGNLDPKTGQKLFSYAHPIFWAPFSLIGDSGGTTPQD